ncbi:hypothetical protein NOK69_25170 [Vibrio parahaemolyticus]|nr:hypothetical protein [Vibrio parahaemolyticus]
MRCSPLNRALCLITKNQWVMVFLCFLSFWFCARRQVGFSGRCFLDTYSLALEIHRVASINFRASARLGRLVQSEI